MYQFDKETGDLVVTGFEKGIQPSPHEGLANVQNANIATEMGEIINSFPRVQDTFTSTSTGTGSLTFADSSHVNLTVAGSNNLFKGNWINVTGSSNTGQLPNGTYYVPPSFGSTYQLANYYNVSAKINPVTINTLVVAGGGGASGTSNPHFSGGGGAGGVVNTTKSVSNLIRYPIVVGAGGTGNNNVGGPNGGSGADSTAFGLDAIGGGGGGSGAAGTAGGSGGGGGTTGSNAPAGGAGTATQGNAGGAAQSTSGASGGGGGGANGAGSAASAATGGNGGAGLASSISGSSLTYGAGGGGSGSTTNGSAGSGTSGFGNGGSAATATGGSGTAGVVVISAPIGTITSATGGTHTTAGGNDIWTFTTSGTWTPTIPTTSAPAATLSGFTAGLTATIQLQSVMGKPMASATETYFHNGTDLIAQFRTFYYRYYMLDSNGLVWVYDSINELLYNPSDNVNWLLPDYNALTGATGIATIDGILVVAVNTGIFGKPTATLGNTNTQSTNFVLFPDANRWQGTSQSTGVTHFCFTGHQGNLYITDGAYIANIFPDSTLADPASTADNVQSFCTYTTPNSATQFQINIISGVTPTTSDTKRLPAVFFSTGTLPPTLTAGTVYYIQTLGDNLNYQVYSASTAGSALDVQTGAVGTQYFNTFWPLATASASAPTGSTPTYVYTPQRLVLPSFEVSQCIAEIGNLVVIGCASSVIYPWNQIDNLPSGIINLPEANVQSIVTVHQMAYIFPGNKGNIYITDGSVASAVTTVPDYVAGVPGTPNSYIEPVFSWGGVMYLRGRVYFSILDQTATKAGNCGGVWSFVPTQNLYIGQDVGIGLRLENQASYGSYNGVSTLLIPKQVQSAVAPQYFNAWESSIASPAYGVDATGTTPLSTSVTVFETDAIPTGTLLDKKTFKQIEYKLTTSLDTSATVSILYRQSLTDAWSSLGNVISDSTLSGYFVVNFEKGQWLQLQVTLTPVTSGSFIRLRELRIR